jgi:hypothetical protein
MKDIVAQLSLTDPWVFISYAKEDRDAAASLYGRLEDDLLRPWLDLHNLPAGVEWDTHIRSVIRKSRFFIVLLSPRAVSKSGYIQKEIAVALDAAEAMPSGRVFILPVLIERCAPPDRLSTWQWIELFRRGGYAKLKATLVAQLGAEYELPQKPVAEPPARPNLHDAADLLIYQRILGRGVLVYASFSRCRKYLSDGTWLQVRRSIAADILALGKNCARFERVKAARMLRLIPSRETYRKDDFLVTSISLNDSYNYSLKTRTGEALAHPDMLRIAFAAYGTPRMYATSGFDPVVVESGGQPVFIFMPMRSDKERAPKASEATSESAPGTVSSAPQG